MPALYITIQGSRLRVSNDCLVVEAPEAEEILLKQPLGHVSEVILFGNVGLTTPAIQKLLSRNIPVTFLNTSGRCYGKLISHLTPHVSLRKAQYSLCDCPDFSLDMAKGLVAAKIRHQKVILQRADQRDPHLDLGDWVTKLDQIEEKISLSQAINSLRGLEGKAAAVYFQGFRQRLPGGWGFDQRKYRPSPDPINAMLSFGYTLLTESATSAIRTVGLDPYAGFLHDAVYNRPSLGLDLVEEFRPVVDGMILWLVNSQMITLADFSIQGNQGRQKQCKMHDRMIKLFLQTYENRMSKTHHHPYSGNNYPLRQCLIEQARQIRKRIESKQPGYQPLGFR